MPSTQNLGWPVQDIERFNKLPFYVWRQQAQRLPYWSRWMKLFGKRKWEQNMGAQVLGVMDEFSPVTTQVHKPTLFGSSPLVTQTGTFQRTNIGRIYKHRFQSEVFHWYPSFNDFQRKGVGHATEDLNKTISVGYDNFCRWQTLQLAPSIWLCGATGSSRLATGLPVGPPGEGNLADPKTPAVFATLASQTTGYLDFKEICAIRSAARYDLGLVPWEGSPGTPKDNAILDGRWLLMGEGNIYEAMTFDSFVLNTRQLEQNLQTREWMGIISGNILFREERYPLRMADDGTFPAPEVEMLLPVNGTITSGSSTVTNPGGAARNVEVIPNPDYVNARFGWAFFFGHQPFEMLEVGPPPAEFASAKLDTARIGKLSWNGEVFMTDNVLVNNGGASGLDLANIDTNKYGDLLQLCAQTSLGFFPNTMRRVIPILYLRNKYPSLTTEA